jgi:phage terminase small subunit
MGKTGRKSRAELATRPAYSPVPERLKPPPELTDTARKVFLDIVAATEPRHFHPSDLPLLCRYCEATALAQQAEAALASAGAVIDGAASPWVAILGQQTKTLQGLSMRLRLSPQARQPNNPKRLPSVSYYDRMKLEHGDAPLPPLRPSWDGWEDKK